MSKSLKLKKLKLTQKIEALKGSMGTDNVEAIRKDFEALTNAFQPIAQKLYAKEQAQAQHAPSGDQEPVDEADYEVVD